jgi:hypothetical protein
MSGSSGAGKHSSSEITGVQADHSPQQQQPAPSLTPWDPKQLGTPAAAAAAPGMPPSLHSPTPSSLGAFATASGPYPSISPSSSSGHTALAAAPPPAAAAAATSAATTSGAGAATVPGSKRAKSKRPLKRGPLFARELAPSKTAGGPGSRQFVINYSPASLTIGELFEVRWRSRIGAGR